MANLTLPLLNGQKVEISGCRNTDYILLGESVVTCNNGKLEPDPKCTQKGWFYKRVEKSVIVFASNSSILIYNLTLDEFYVYVLDIVMRNTCFIHVRKTQQQEHQAVLVGR